MKEQVKMGDETSKIIEGGCLCGGVRYCCGYWRRYQKLGNMTNRTSPYDLQEFLADQPCRCASKNAPPPAMR